MINNREDEERLLRSVVGKNARSIFLARQRAEDELLRAKEALEARTAELAESLSMMQATLESTADGILATDRSGSVSGFNERFVGMWRVPGDVVAMRDHRLLLDEMSRRLPDPAGFLSTVDAILAEDPPESFDVLELADGTVFERYSRVQYVSDRTIGRVWSYRDVTERARGEAELLQAKREAEAASRSKSAFLATMSHELRTPLNAIAGYADLLDLEIQGPLTERQRESLARIQASQRHLLGLIDEVLIHAKLETGNIQYHASNLLVRDALTGAQSMIAPQAGAKGQTVEVSECSPELAVWADPEKLQQILANLLSNAVKFTNPGGRVEIACRRSSDHVEIVVRDTGIGIPASELDTIFEPFVQVHAELTRTASGTGLGLAISRSLARGMDGDLAVQSSSGAGSEFTLTLPAHETTGPLFRESAK